ncbi:ATP-dependent helicase [Candidatus Gottesmanbacteria bacterium]|nr:ATP-dependent helicase [Candidatus Gottesmanbacteria bacterium]
MRDTQEKKLNKEQLEAIHHREGALLIVAGAGTGKTTVITERVKWLIAENLAKPAEILALTFTDKAAREMETRVDIALPYGYTQMWITTFHAFGERVLRQEAIHIGLDPGYKLMAGAESIIFFRKNLFKFELNYFRPLGNPTKFIEGMLQHFNRLKDEDISPSEYIRWAQAQSSKLKAQSDNEEGRKEIEKYIELANAYQKYEELKVKEGVMDFADLISNTLQLFRERKNILRAYQEQFKYVLIDEFQDTNFAQNELAILLSGDKKNITVVGDDDQAIYRWRGAAISNIIQFKKRFPEAKLVVLSKNYRSTSEILNRVYTLIQFNNPDRLEVKENISKKLESERKIKGEKVEFIYTERVEDEAEEAAKKIKNEKLKIKNEEGKEIYSWKDFAILVRANSYADPFTRALQRAGIPYQFLGPGMLFRQPEVKDLIAYLKLLYDFSDSVAVFRVLSMPIFDIPSRDLAAVNNFAKRVGLSIYEAAETIVAYQSNNLDHWSKQKNYQAYLPYISSKTKETLERIVKMVERHLKLAKTESAGQILYFFLEDTGMLRRLAEYKTAKEERVALNISKFFDKLKTYEAEHEDASVSAVVDWIEMALELGESPLAADLDWTENDAVNILTVHSSKGLEFPVVFLVNLVNQRFPVSNRREQIPIPDDLVKEILPEGDYHLEEERRLFYVGATRARDRLFFTAANYYGEGKRERKISPFVVEMLGEEIERITQLVNKPINQLTLLDWKKQEELSEKVIRQPIEYLSYSQIDTFMTCPLQYKYRYILKIPVPPSAAGSFGTSMHIALQKFYEKVKKGEKPTKDDLLKLLTDVWLPVGFGTKQYEEKMKKRGYEMLSTFYEKLYDPKVVPKSLEQVFKIKLTPDLKIGGKIDRVDETSSGKLEIIDYKTGKRPSEKEIKDNLQMTVYALAASDPGIYNKKPEEVILSFYFFDAYEKISSTRTNEQLIEAKKKLIGKADEIATSSFEPKTGPWCDFCDFRLICEAWQS